MGRLAGWLAGSLPAWAWVLAGIVSAAALWIWIERTTAAGWRDRAEAAELRSGRLRGQIDRLTALNAGNATELARLREGHARDLADLGAELARARKAGTRLTIVRQEIARDPDAAAPMADRCPALDRLFDRMLRNRDGAAPGDADRAGGRPASGGPAGMPARAPAAAGAADDG